MMTCNNTVIRRSKLCDFVVSSPPLEGYLTSNQVYLPATYTTQLAFVQLKMQAEAGPSAQRMAFS